MQRRFVELHNVHSGRVVWVDAASIVMMKATVRMLSAPSEMEPVTDIRFVFGGVDDVLEMQVRETPEQILSAMGAGFGRATATSCKAAVLP